MKKREKPHRLLVLESLNVRTDLSEEEKKELLQQGLGYGGECQFDVPTEGLTCDCLILQDLPLEVGGTDFQIDAMIITAHEIGLYEVKNYGGEYIYEDGFFVGVASGKSFHSPTERVNRHQSLMQSLLEKLQMKMPVKSYVVFVHPEFMLYDKENKHKVLMQATLPKHLRKLNERSGRISKKQQLLAEKLCELSAATKPYMNGVPEYTYEGCRKGMICAECGAFVAAVPFKCKTLVCASCGHTELVTAGISRHALEYVRLFPGRKLSVAALFDWCGGVCPERRIRVVLQKEYQAVGVGKAVHYV